MTSAQEEADRIKTHRLRSARTRRKANLPKAAEFPYLAAHTCFTDRSVAEMNRLLQQAHNDNAPSDIVYQEGDHWVRLGEIEDMELLKKLTGPLAWPV